MDRWTEQILNICTEMLNVKFIAKFCPLNEIHQETNPFDDLEPTFVFCEWGRGPKCVLIKFNIPDLSIIYFCISEICITT